MSDLESGRAAIDLALNRVRSAQRGTRQAAQGLAKARDALHDVTYLRLTGPGDIDDVARVLREALEHGDVDLIVLHTTDHSPTPGAQTEGTP